MRRHGPGTDVNVFNWPNTERSGYGGYSVTGGAPCTALAQTPGFISSGYIVIQGYYAECLCEVEDGAGSRRSLRKGPVGQGE